MTLAILKYGSIASGQASKPSPLLNHWLHRSLSKMYEGRNYVSKVYAFTGFLGKWVYPENAFSYSYLRCPDFVRFIAEVVLRTLNRQHNKTIAVGPVPNGNQKQM